MAPDSRRFSGHQAMASSLRYRLAARSLSSGPSTSEPIVSPGARCHTPSLVDGVDRRSEHCTAVQCSAAAMLMWSVLKRVNLQRPGCLV
jgi:hypothetical protein